MSDLSNWRIEGGRALVLGSVDHADAQERLEATCSSGSFIWVSSSHDSHLLGTMGLAGDSGSVRGGRLVALAPDGQPIWASGIVIHNVDDRELWFDGCGSPAPNGSNFPLAIASSGDSIYVISAPRQISITGIRRVE
jgi:hypothetical protein